MSGEPQDIPSKIPPKQDTPAIDWLENKCMWARSATKWGYHIYQPWDGMNHWSDFVELSRVLGHIRWQQQRIENLENWIAAAKERM